MALRDRAERRLRDVLRICLMRRAYKRRGPVTLRPFHEQFAVDR